MSESVEWPVGAVAWRVMGAGPRPMLVRRHLPDGRLAVSLKNGAYVRHGGATVRTWGLSEQIIRPDDLRRQHAEAVAEIRRRMAVRAARRARIAELCDA